MDDLCSEDGQRVYLLVWQKRWLCSVPEQKDRFFWYNFLFEQIIHIRTAVHGHPQLSLKCKLPNRIWFDVFDRCFLKGGTRECETLNNCAKRLGQWFPTFFDAFLPVLILELFIPPLWHKTFSFLPYYTSLQEYLILKYILSHVSRCSLLFEFVG